MGIYLMDYADLTRRFWKWYDTNISIVDFQTIERDIDGKTSDEIRKKLCSKLGSIYGLLDGTRYFKDDKAFELKAIRSSSLEELALKLAIQGY